MEESRRSVQERVTWRLPPADSSPVGGSGGISSDASFEGRPAPLAFAARTWNTRVAPAPPATLAEVVDAPLFGRSSQDSQVLAGRSAATGTATS